MQEVIIDVMLERIVRDLPQTRTLLSEPRKEARAQWRQQQHQGESRVEWWTCQAYQTRQL